MTSPAPTNDAPGRQRVSDRDLVEMEYAARNCDFSCAKWLAFLVSAHRAARVEIASLKREIEEARADEREKCAQIADAMNDGDTAANRRIAVAIRARKDDAS